MVKEANLQGIRKLKKDCSSYKTCMIRKVIVSNFLLGIITSQSWKVLPKEVIIPGNQLFLSTKMKTSEVGATLMFPLTRIFARTVAMRCLSQKQLITSVQL